jgi:hypothetical protein
MPRNAARASLARINTELATPVSPVPPEFIERINAGIDPATSLRPDDVYIRAMYIVSDQVNSFGGRFPADEHPRLVDLLIDSPVLVGHRKDKLPIGRTFHAVTSQRDDEQWVKSYFYWLKSVDGAETLKNNIDGGIYKECSVAFNYYLPECSICGRDIRQCKHEPFGIYRVEDTDTICHYNYRKIERVLETSLVYRGAVPNTRISADLQDSCVARDERNLTELTDPSTLEPDTRYYIVPYYDGIPLCIATDADGPTIRTPHNEDLDHPITEYLAGIMPSGDGASRALLVGYRGKERQPRSATERFIRGKKSSVRRLVLWLYPNTELKRQTINAGNNSIDAKTFPHRLTASDRVRQQALEITTRDGVEIWPENDSPWGDSCFRYHPDQGEKQVPGLQIWLDQEKQRTFCRIHHQAHKDIYEISGFNVDRFQQGRRFVARVHTLSQAAEESRESIIQLPVAPIQSGSPCVKVLLNDNTVKKVIIRPARLAGKMVSLIYLASERK